MQLQALRDAGCEDIFQEDRVAWGRPRPIRARILRELKCGDVLVVQKFNRLSHSLRDLVFTLEMIEAAGAHFVSLAEIVGPVAIAGEPVSWLVPALANFERDTVRMTMRPPLNRGRGVGRKPKLKAAQRAEIIRLIQDGEATSSTAADLFDVSKSTVKRVLQAHRAGLAA